MDEFSITSGQMELNRGKKKEATAECKRGNSWEFLGRGAPKRRGRDGTKITCLTPAAFLHVSSNQRPEMPFWLIHVCEWVSEMHLSGHCNAWRVPVCRDNWFLCTEYSSIVHYS